MSNGKQFGLTGNFGFTGRGLTGLTENAYFGAKVVLDLTGSIGNFAPELRQMLINIILGGRKGDYAYNLTMSASTFNSYDGIQQLFDWQPSLDIDENGLPTFQPRGMTNLIDGSLHGVGSLEACGDDIIAKKRKFSGALYVVSDGEENNSLVTDPGQIKAMAEAIRRSEKFGGLSMVLIGIKTSGDSLDALAAFKDAAGFDQYIDAGDASPAKIAHLGGIISKSISTHSQNVATGGASQHVDLNF